jgi:hypothetical protein
MTAKRVPDPMVKCVVWAASPMSTMFSWHHVVLVTCLNRSQRAGSPRDWLISE